MNWKVFPGAVAAPYWTTCVRFFNASNDKVPVDIVFGPYRMQKKDGNPCYLSPGEIAFDLRDLAKWNFFNRPKKGDEGIVEGCLYIEDLPLIEVFAQIEHIHAWIGGRVPREGQGRQQAPAIIPLPSFEYSGEAPCGENFGRVGGSEDSPFYGPGNVI
jgi:hypothetical protein